MNVPSHPDLLLGLDRPDDAGVFRISPDTALVQTLDFLTPVTDDPYDFGRIAAANSLSDVYAMGGRPLTAMNIVCFPGCDLGTDVLARILEGGLEKIREAGAVLLGGHSVDDPELKYGLSVTGRVHPDRILANSTARTGDALILTKPVGTGVLSTAVKAKLATSGQIKSCVDVMAGLNRYAAEIMTDYDVSACTDVTGFGLAGHLVEMARGSEKSILLHSEKVGVLEGALEFAGMGLIPAGAHKNRKFFKPFVRIGAGVTPVLADLIFDPQTSGGLLISLGAEQAADCLAQLGENGIPAGIIGKVKDGIPDGFLDIV